MKIAQIIIGYHPTVGGYGRHVNLISNGLRKLGHEVTILSTNYSPGTLKPEVGVKRFFNSPFLKCTPGLFFHLLRNHYDLVHVHGYPSFLPFTASLAHIFNKFPFVFTPHFHPFGTKPRFFRRLFDFFFGSFSLRAADRVIALTDYERGLLSKTVPFNRIRVVPNPVDLSRLKRVSGFKTRHNLRDYVLFVGRIERDKGINFLIKALKGLGIDLVVVGKDVGYAKELIKESYVHVIGEVSQDELMAAYSECNLLVMPSRYEAFGITFIEAMSYGKPVIGSDVGPVKSVIDGAGLTVPYGDVASLRTAVKRVLKNPSRFKREALIRAKLFSVSKVSTSVLNVYKELVK